MPGIGPATLVKPPIATILQPGGVTPLNKQSQFYAAQLFTKADQTSVGGAANVSGGGPASHAGRGSAVPALVNTTEVSGSSSYRGGHGTSAGKGAVGGGGVLQQTADEITALLKVAMNVTKAVTGYLSNLFGK